MIEPRSLSDYMQLSTEIVDTCRDPQDTRATMKVVDKLRLLAIRTVPHEGDEWHATAYGLCYQGASLLRDAASRWDVATSEIADRFFGDLLKTAERQSDAVTVTGLADYIGTIEKQFACMTPFNDARMRYTSVRDCRIGTVKENNVPRR